MSLLDSRNIGNTLANHTSFLSNAETFWRICEGFSSKSEENKGIVQRVAYLIMDSISNTLIAILDNNDLFSNANMFLHSILECSRKTDAKALFDHGLACVPEYLYHFISNMIAQEGIIYDQFVPEKSATKEDISRFFDGAEIPQDFDKLFNPGTRKMSAEEAKDTDFNACYVKDFVTDFDKMLSLRDSVATSEPAEIISVLSAFLSLANAVKIEFGRDDIKTIRESITPKLFELSRMYFELLSHSARDDDLGKSVRVFLEVPGASEIIPNISSVLERVCGEASIARNLRWTYGLSVILGGIAPQMRAESAALPDTLAAVALGNAIKMFSEGADISPESKEKSFKVEVLPRVEMSLCDPAGGEKVFLDRIKGLGHADPLDFFLMVTNAYWDAEFRSGTFMLIVRQCVALLKNVMNETPLDRPTHLIQFAHILEKLSVKSDKDLLDFAQEFRKRLVEKKDMISAETNGTVLEEIYREYKMNLPFHVVQLVRDIIDSKKWKEEAISGLFNRFVDDLIAVVQVPNEDKTNDHEILSYRMFCLATYIFGYALSQESKLAILTKMTNFIIANQDKKLHQFGLIRFLIVMTCNHIKIKIMYIFFYL